MIVFISITVGGVFVLNSQEQMLRDGARTKAQEAITTAATDDLAIINVVGHEVSGRNISYVRFQVQYDGEGELPLNETLIQLRTRKTTADLQYRNGTLERSVAEGYFTN